MSATPSMSDLRDAWCAITGTDGASFDKAIREHAAVVLEQEAFLIAPADWKHVDGERVAANLSLWLQRRAAEERAK